MGKRWVEIWKHAGEALERVRLKELRELDPYQAIAMLCGRSMPTESPRASSGLVEQQRWFMKVHLNS